jgi:hypothetical protein
LLIGVAVDRHVDRVKRILRRTARQQPRRVREGIIKRQGVFDLEAEREADVGTGRVGVPKLRLNPIAADGTGGLTIESARDALQFLRASQDRIARPGRLHGACQHDRRQRQKSD